MRSPEERWRQQVSNDPCLKMDIAPIHLPREVAEDEQNPNPNLIDLHRILLPRQRTSWGVGGVTQAGSLGLDGAEASGKRQPDHRLPRTTDRGKRPPDALLPATWWDAVAFLANQDLRIAVEKSAAAGLCFLLARTHEGPVGPVAEAAMYRCLSARRLVIVNYGPCEAHCRHGERFFHFFRVERRDGSLPKRREIRRAFRFDPLAS